MSKDSAMAPGMLTERMILSHDVHVGGSACISSLRLRKWWEKGDFTPKERRWRDVLRKWLWSVRQVTYSSLVFPHRKTFFKITILLLPPTYLPKAADWLPWVVNLEKERPMCGSGGPFWPRVSGIFMYTCHVSGTSLFLYTGRVMGLAHGERHTAVQSDAWQGCVT